VFAALGLRWVRLKAKPKSRTEITNPSFSANLWRQYSFHVQLFKHPDVVGNVTNLIEMLSPLLCHATIVLESIYKRKREAQIGELMRKIQLKLNYASRCSIKTLPLVKFLWLFVINSSVYGLILGMIWHSVGMEI
jgi:hypothetical protein